jgi:hypothetical protein
MLLPECADLRTPAMRADILSEFLFAYAMLPSTARKLRSACAPAHSSVVLGFTREMLRGEA